MKEETKLNCASIKRFDGKEDIISIKINVIDDNDDLHEDYEKIVIYVGEDPIVSIPSEYFPSIEDLIEEIIDKSYTSFCNEENTSLEILLKGLYLDIGAWSNNNYESQFLYYKLSFPLLKKLKEVGETKFQIIFQQEILRRYATGTEKVKEFLERKGYLNLISDFF
ncbi:MAG: hypothetical protein ACW98D_04235 [Promethearchaeota archaeon]|jgi:hypothetical protein